MIQKTGQDASWYERIYLDDWVSQGAKRVGQTRIVFQKDVVISLDTIKVNVNWNTVRFVLHRKYNKDNEFKGHFSMTAQETYGMAVLLAPGMIDAMYLDKDQSNKLAANKSLFLEELNP